jgi:hypothetical protein
MRSASGEVPDLVRQFDSIVSDARSLAGSLSDEAFNRQPEPGRWSVGQCLEHLNITERKMLENMRPAAREALASRRRAGAPTRHGWMMGWFIRSMEPPPKRRFKTGAGFVPAVALSRDAVLNDFLSLHEDVVAMLRELDGHQMSVKVQSPFARLLRYKLGSAFALMAAHDRRHLWQAHEAARALAQPT